MNSMKSLGTLLALTAAALAGSQAGAQEFSAQLSGFSEVPAAISSPGTGTLRVNLNQEAGTLDYTLEYSGLTTPATQAHIHLGQQHVAGGIMVFLCSNAGNGPAGTPACPPDGGTVSGTLQPAGVVGPEAQNVTPGDFAAVAKALTSEASYGNVHSTKFPAGEIRGELRPTTTTPPQTESPTN